MERPRIGRETIRSNYQRVVEQIYTTAAACGRNGEDIRLVVVTKTHPVDTIQAVIEAGATDLGENYLEEALPKMQALSNNQNIHWHMIGHIQSRKAKAVCEHFQYVHSLDSLKLAYRLNQFANELGKSLPVYLEFNVGGEESKSGWSIAHEEDWDAQLAEIEKVFSLPRLSFLGVMAVPPFSTNPEDSRVYYRQLRAFRDHLASQLHPMGFNEYSMGMSSDFEVAIQEGSTCLRIGTAILGPRR